MLSLFGEMQITYLFLYTVPALFECLAVTLVFLFKFKLWSMSLIAFCGVVAYVTLTVSITLWRKKFREATNKHDNDYHDKATDSIINYEVGFSFCCCL
jgi:ABC-type transport system involved in Fe-S cluster assembly fused permease/ATPase subunit